MSTFTYDIPREDEYLSVLLLLLKGSDENDILELLTGGECSIAPSKTYSRRRRNAYLTEVRFYVSADKYGLVSPEIKKRLLDYCQRIMPTKAGYDVESVSITPRLGGKEQKSLNDEINEVSKTLDNMQKLISLPADLADRGKEMAEVYLFLYYAENVLRLFIEQIACDAHGPQFFTHLTVPKSSKDGITARKRNEQKNKWLRIRGDSDLYYLDFKDLGDIILNNWPLFSKYFPDQAWIKTKIEEMANCRNLVAHNSYVGEHEREVIRLNFRGIIRQLEQHIGQGCKVNI